MASLPSPPPSVRRRLGRGRQTSLFQWRNPAFWLYAVIVVGAASSLLGEQSAFRDIAPSGWVLSWFLLALYALPVFLAVTYLDLYEREPSSLVLGALVWGAVAATTLAGLGNEGWATVVSRLGGPEFASRWTAALTAPFVEETIKVIGVVLICMIAGDEVDDTMDGFVYGAMVGLGFAVVEDVFYFIGVFGGTTGGVLAGFYVRVISSGLYGHVLYTGLAGMGVAFFFSRRSEVPLGRRVLVAAGLFLAGVAGHFLWNSPFLDLFPREVSSAGDLLRIPVAAAVKGLPLLLFVIVLVRLARRRERRWLDAALRSEAGRPSLSTEELAVLVTPAARRRSIRAMRARAGDRAARLLKRLQREQVNLAMVRTRVEADDDPDLARQREYCKSLRDALAAIPGAASAATAPDRASA
jgi:RsiW-degrading membrane proteinase PrsW (M82 family)